MKMIKILALWYLPHYNKQDKNKTNDAGMKIKGEKI